MKVKRKKMKMQKKKCKIKQTKIIRIHLKERKTYKVRITEKGRAEQIDEVP